MTADPGGTVEVPTGYGLALVMLSHRAPLAECRTPPRPTMASRQGGKLKPLKQPKKQKKEMYDDSLKYTYPSTLDYKPNLGLRDMN